MFQEQLQPLESQVIFLAFVVLRFGRIMPVALTRSLRRKEIRGGKLIYLECVSFDRLKD